MERALDFSNREGFLDRNARRSNGELRASAPPFSGASPFETEQRRFSRQGRHSLGKPTGSSRKRNTGSGRLVSRRRYARWPLATRPESSFIGNSALGDLSGREWGWSQTV